jgi:hypothetical protein
MSIPAVDSSDESISAAQNVAVCVVSIAGRGQWPLPRRGTDVRVLLFTGGEFVDQRAQLAPGHASKVRVAAAGPPPARHAARATNETANVL